MKIDSKFVENCILNKIFFSDGGKWENVRNFEGLLMKFV